MNSESIRFKAKLKKITSRFCPERTATRKGRHCPDCGCLIPTQKQREEMAEC